MRAARFLVCGRVQGVGFRAATRREAERLGISGYAHNRDDGRVEVLAVGAAAAITALADWLRHGPRFARVDSLAREELDPPPPVDAGFRVA